MGKCWGNTVQCSPSWNQCNLSNGPNRSKWVESNKYVFCCIFRGGRLRDHLYSILFPSISVEFGSAKYIKIHMTSWNIMKRSCHYTWTHCRLYFGGKNHGLIVLYLGHDMPWPIMTLRFFLCFLRCRLTMFRRIRFARPNLSLVLHILRNFNPFYACDFLPADFFPSHR